MDANLNKLMKFINSNRVAAYSIGIVTAIILAIGLILIFNTTGDNNSLVKDLPPHVSSDSTLPLVATQSTGNSPIITENVRGSSNQTPSSRDTGSSSNSYQLQEEHKITFDHMTAFTECLSAMSSLNTKIQGFVDSNVFGSSRTEEDKVYSSCVKLSDVSYFNTSIGIFYSLDLLASTATVEALIVSAESSFGSATFYLDGESDPDLIQKGTVHFKNARNNLREANSLFKNLPK